jgi:hypothetical protein
VPGLLRILRVRLALRLSSWIPLPKGEGSSFFVEMFLTHNDKRLARGITPKFTLTPKIHPGGRRRGRTLGYFERFPASCRPYLNLGTND